MNSRRINQTLHALAALCVTGGMLLAVWLWSRPLDLPTAATRGPQRPSALSAKDPASPDDRISFAGRTFRATAAATSAATSVAPVSQNPNDLSNVQLVGTIGDSIAMLRGPDGSTALAEVGDDVNGAAVIAIRPFQVDLKLNGRKTTLVKVDSAGGNVTDPNATAWPDQP